MTDLIELWKFILTVYGLIFLNLILVWIVYKIFGEEIKEGGAE